MRQCHQDGGQIVAVTMRGDAPGVASRFASRKVVYAMTTQPGTPRCPQWWKVFSVRGRTGGSYEVHAKHLACDEWRCNCKASEFGDCCWHIKRVLAHACLAGPDRAAGPGDLAAFDVAITDRQHPVPRATTRTRIRCACGEPMLSPKLRMSDDAGHQIVEVQIGGRGAYYAYATRRKLAVGDVVTHYHWSDDGVVAGLGTDYDGPLADLP